MENSGVVFRSDLGSSPRKKNPRRRVLDAIGGR
jgi:hypothetical protein